MNVTGFEAIDEMIVQAAQRGLVLYEILNRNAGWGILWYDITRHASGADFHGGLFVNLYRPTLIEAVHAEIELLQVVTEGGTT